MKQATRRLLAIRDGSEYIPQVTLKPADFAQVGECHKNALAEAKRTDWASKVACGWIVTPFIETSQFSAVMFHYWNIDADGNHYDVSPNMDYDDYDYVLDSDVHYESKKFSKTVSDEMWFFPPSLKFYNKSVKNSFALATREASDGNSQWLPIIEQPATIMELMKLRNWANPYCEEFKLEELTDW
jgi:hypothetical protein